MHARRWWVAALVAAAPVVGNAQIAVPTIPGFPTVTCTPVGPVGVAADVTANALAAPMVLAVARLGETTVCTDVSSMVRVSGKLWSLTATGISIGGLGRADLTVTANQDPFLNFGATTMNMVAGPVTYAFLFGTPIVPGQYNNATATGGVSVTNGPSATGGQTTGSVTAPGIAPTFISGYGTLGATATNLGVNLGTAPCTATGAPSQVTTTCNYGTIASNFAPTTYDNLEALLTYNQTGLNSVASWSGAVTLNAVSTVPEPTTVALLGSALLMLGAGRMAVRRRA